MAVEEDAMAADTDMAVIMAVAVVMAMAVDTDMVAVMATVTIMLAEALYAAALIIKNDYFGSGDARDRNLNFNRPANIYI